mgnify:FL=1
MNGISFFFKKSDSVYGLVAYDEIILYDKQEDTTYRDTFATSMDTIVSIWGEQIYAIAYDTPRDYIEALRILKWYDLGKVRLVNEFQCAALGCINLDDCSERLLHYTKDSKSFWIEIGGGVIECIGDEIETTPFEEVEMKDSANYIEELFKGGYLMKTLLEGNRDVVVFHYLPYKMGFEIVRDGEPLELIELVGKGTNIPMRRADIVDMKVGDKLFFTIDDEKVRIPSSILDFDGKPELEGEICVDIDADSMVMLEVTKKRVMLKDLV